MLPRSFVRRRPRRRGSPHSSQPLPPPHPLFTRRAQHTSEHSKQTAWPSLPRLHAFLSLLLARRNATENVDDVVRDTRSPCEASRASADVPPALTEENYGRHSAGASSQFITLHGRRGQRVGAAGNASPRPPTLPFCPDCSLGTPRAARLTTIVFSDKY